MFDLDGTLIDSVKDIATSANYMLKTLDRSQFNTDDFRHWIGDGATVMVNRALSGNRTINPDLSVELKRHARQIFIDHYLQHPCVNTELYPQVKETLDALKSQGFKLAIVTNKPSAFIEPIMAKLSLTPLIDYHIGGDSLCEKKPHPMQLLHCCEHFNITPEHALMVGDSANDVVAAQNANIQSVAVSYGYHGGVDLTTLNPCAFINQFNQLLNVLKS